MPPRRKLVPRCIWEDGRGRCRSEGAGEPALCLRHYRWLYYGEGAQSVDGVAAEDVLNRILDHPSVQRLGRTVDQRVQGLFDQLGAAVDRASSRVFDRQPHLHPQWQGPGQAYAAEWPPRPPQQEKRRQQRAQPPPAQPQPPAEDPYIVLGFPPGTKQTAEAIKRRRRELARILHSDAGGSDESMKRINAAADALLASLP